MTRKRGNKRKKRSQLLARHSKSCSAKFGQKEERSRADKGLKRGRITVIQEKRLVAWGCRGDSISGWKRKSLGGGGTQRPTQETPELKGVFKFNQEMVGFIVEKTAAADAG